MDLLFQIEKSLIEKGRIPCVADGPKTLLKLKVFRPSFPDFEGVTMVMLPSSMEPTVEGLPCPGKKGRTLQYTLIFPVYKKHKKKLGQHIFIFLSKHQTFAYSG